MADAPTPLGSSNPHACPPSLRPARCVVLHDARRPTPDSLVRTFESRGVSVCVHSEPLLALAELGSQLVEHRQQAARQATFHDKGAPAHPSLILVIIEPADFDDLDELIGCVAHAMPQVTISAYQGDVNPSLRVLQRGQAPAAASSHQRSGAPTPAPPPRRGLRLTESQREAPHAPTRPPADWLSGAMDDIEESEDQPEAAEALISQAELAMLLGDDYGFGADDESQERGT